MATHYLESCQALSVVPASCLLRQGSASELNLRHRGLGPQVSLREPGNRKDVGDSGHLVLESILQTHSLPLCHAYPIPHACNTGWRL